VQRGSVRWCSVAQFMVRRGSVYGAAWLSLWCGVAQFMVRRGSVRWCGVRRLAVRQVRVLFSARHHREIFPTELTSDEEVERGPDELRQIYVLYECD
jgi:hypothetical protein